ncbi:hypothetical protein [Sulfurospirillum deleyianum]|uniref:Uncharacterized protein n=1 Tax=Sulfurospirillum deleyianum (strain ATCC 51133 / DSM 6946 / 5175) TaxID=525898 RepID=D1B261_SULD5|nr:hypothetical protein [Sulfurospirillum deleyianum]ACZ12181.1 hypothetical protein Sdel_1158 [Sulfurospirillum deleyianum DSM 6946]
MKFKVFAFGLLCVWCFSVNLIFNGQDHRYTEMAKVQAQEILKSHEQSLLIVHS